MNEEDKLSPNSFLDNSNCRQKSTINTNFNHCRYMLDSEMNIWISNDRFNFKKNI